MTHRLTMYFLGFALGVLPAVSLEAQSDEKMAEVFEWKFETAPPDVSFQVMPDETGWEEPATAAKIICMATPVPYSKMEQDLGAITSEEGQTLLEKTRVEINGVSGLLILLEFAPMDGTDTETVYSLMFARPFQDVSLVLNAQYPKSEHERLYPKMLTAFGTVRKK